MRGLLWLMVPTATAVGTITVLCAEHLPVSRWALVLALAVLAVLAQKGTAVTRWLGLGQSLMGVVQALSWTLVGPYAAVVACCAPLLVSRMRSPKALAYNTTSLLILSCAGWWGFHMAGGELLWRVESPLRDLALPVAAGSVAQLLVNVALILPGLAVMRGHRMPALLVDAARALRVGWANQVAGGVLLTLLVWALRPHGVGVLLAAGPLLVHMAVLTTIQTAETGQTQALRIITRAAQVSDPHVEEHGARVAGYAQEMARHLRMGPHQVESLDLAARLHDIGWVALPTERTDRETEHPARGARMLADLPFLDAAAQMIARSHDFSGSATTAATGDQSELALRVLQVADALDAVVCARPEATVEEVADLLAEEPGRYAPIVVEALRSCRPVLRRPQGDTPLPDWWVHDLPTQLRAVAR